MEAIILVSDKFETFVSFEVPEQQSVAARIANAEFLEPLKLTWPDSLEPPFIMSFASHFACKSEESILGFS